MPPDFKDMARLWDMMEAAQFALEFTKGMTIGQFLADRKTRSAVERHLEIIGEAARGVSQETRDAYPHVPWRAMIALRNVLAHEYGDILYENLWRVCSERLPELVNQLQSMGVAHPPE